jgi:hypothetical protein
MGYIKPHLVGRGYIIQTNKKIKANAIIGFWIKD